MLSRLSDINFRILQLSRMPLNPRRMVVVGLDFGTTYSGFSFALISEPYKINSFFEYPNSSNLYPKTPTVSYYKKVPGHEDQWRLNSWGFTARSEYTRDMAKLTKEQRRRKHSGAQNDNAPLPEVGRYITKFKLYLANERMARVPLPSLPAGLTNERVITDYLREMGALILKTLRGQYRNLDLTNDLIQWCITVPSIWDNVAKSVMKDCMVRAGLVSGTDDSHLSIVLEPEAAFFHCYQHLHESAITVNDKILIADIGGGTSDIVVEQVVAIGQSSYQVKEVTFSSGGLCGSIYVDQSFIKFMIQSIPCLDGALDQQPSLYASLLKEWDEAKASFGDLTRSNRSTDISLHYELLNMMKPYASMDNDVARALNDGLYEIRYDQMKSIFDPIINQNLTLISDKLREVQGVTVIAVVGGLAKSEYLIQCIKRRFSSEVRHIIVPGNPVSAISLGAVMSALNPDTIISRVSKKTYGVECVEEFKYGVDREDHLQVINNLRRCRNRFHIYVRKGDVVNVDQCISKTYYPARSGQTTMDVTLFSSENTNPRYTDEPGVKMEGSFTIDISGDMTLDEKRIVKESLYFGRSSLELVAEPVNFFLGSQGPNQLHLPIAEGFV